MKYIWILLVLLGTSVNALADEPVNLLVNGSMEYWHLSGLRPQGWGVWTPDLLRSTWKVTRDEKIKHDGHASMCIQVGDWANAYAGVRVQPGQTYTFSMYVRCDQPAHIGVTLHLGGKEIAPDERVKNRKLVNYDLTPNQWQRVSVTDTMPPDATQMTTYLLLRGKGVWHLDMGMLNTGPLVDYIEGVHYQPITPLARKPVVGETSFVPALWDGEGKTVDDQEVAFCFDSDVLSTYRLRNGQASIGAIFKKPVRLRGLCLLLDEAQIPEDVKLTIQVMQVNQWSDIPFETTAVGVSSLLAFEPMEVQAIRLKFDTRRKMLNVYHFGFAQ